METKVINPKMSDSFPSSSDEIAALERSELLKKVKVKKPTKDEKGWHNIKTYQDLLPNLTDLKRPHELGYQDHITKETESGNTIDVNTTELKWMSYFTQVRRMVAMTYTSPYSRISKSKAIQKKLLKYGKARMRGICVVAIKIERSGIMTKSYILKSSGDDEIDQFWLNILNMTAPYPPLPKHYKEDTLEFTYSLSYDLIFTPPRNATWPKQKHSL